MIAIVKAIIIAVIVVGVAAPTAYVAYGYLSTSSPQMTHFIPSGASAVIDYHVNGTNAVAYSSNVTAGLLINYNMTAFTNTFKASNKTTNDSFNGTNLNITLVKTYDSFNIYRVSGINFSSKIGGFASLMNGSYNNETIYLSPIGSSFLVVSNLTGVEMSINANHSGNYLKVHQDFLSVKNNGIAFYLNLSALDYSKALPVGSSSGVSVYSHMFKSKTLYGNVSNYYTNITITKMSQSMYKNVSLLNGILPSNLTVSTSYKNEIYHAEYNIGLKNYLYVINKMGKNTSSSISS